jgi:hypothetical protein
MEQDSAGAPIPVFIAGTALALSGLLGTTQPWGRIVQAAAAGVTLGRMADEPAKPDTGDERCVACDIVWYALMAAGVLTIAFMAWDVFSQGQATELVAGLFRKVSPNLAVVKPIREEGGDSGHGAAG